MLRSRSIAVLASTALLAACGSSGAKPHADSSSTSSTVVVTTGATIPPPDGMPAFYSEPDPLPKGKPGAVIKTEPVAIGALHGTLLRVMYHSRSLLNRDIPVTGLIAVPSAPPPAGGYPVISWAHGTTGIADICAPSLSPDGYADLTNALLDAGYVVVGTDYEGLGTPGRHPFIVGESEARGTIDIVRAARNVAAVHAGDRYLVWGHSQGGHAAMFSLHIADAWAPELHLVGVVAGAPPSQLSLMYAALQNSPFKFYLLMVAAGFNAAYGDKGAQLDAVLTPEGTQAISNVDHGCAGDIAKATASLATTALVRGDPTKAPAWAKLLTDNDPGQFAGPAKEPLLIIHGGNDEQIPLVSSQLLFDQLCKIGQVEQRWVYPGQSHAGVVRPSFPDMLKWIGDRFAGGPVPDPAAPTGLPDVQAQRCPS